MATALEQKWAAEKAARPIVSAPLSTEERAQVERMRRTFRENVESRIANRAAQDRRAHHAGEVARELNRFRVTPYYNDPISDRFWYAGYDGKSWEQAKDEFGDAFTAFHEGWA